MSFGIHQLEDRDWTFKKNITVTGSATITSNLVCAGNFTFGDATTDNLIVAGDLRVNDDRFLHFGTGEDVSIEYDENGTDKLVIHGAGWTFAGTSVIHSFAGTSRIQFRDSAVYVNSATDGYLDLTADVGINLTAGTVNLNATTVTMDSGAVLHGAGTGTNGILISNPKNTAGLVVSGTATVLMVNIGGTTKYIQCYDNNA